MEKKKKVRLDAYLVDQGFFETRSKAQAAIMAGQVLADDQKIDKPGTSVKEGTKIRFTGYKSEWAGEVEIVPDSLEPIEVIRGGIYISKPVDVTDVLGDEDQLAEYMNQRVSFTGMTVEPNYAVEEETETATEAEEGNETEAETEGAELAFMYGWDGSGSEGDDLYFNASVDGKVYTFVVESNLCDENSEVYQTVKNLKVGDQIDMEGFLYWYEGAQPHIISVTLPEEEE